MSRVIVRVSEANLLAILESLNELVHLEFLTDPKLQRILDFSSLKNLLSNELFLSFIYFYYKKEVKGRGRETIRNNFRYGKEDFK